MCNVMYVCRRGLEKVSGKPCALLGELLPHQPAPAPAKNG